MADPLRHRQTKGAATDMVDLTPPRHIPTLPPAVTLGRADCGQAGALPADATAVQIDAALLAAACGLIVRVPALPSPSFEALDDGDVPLLTPEKPMCWPQSPRD